MPDDRDIDLAPTDYRQTKGPRRREWAFSFTNLIIMVVVIGFVFLIAKGVGAIVVPAMDWLFTALGL